MLNARVVGHCDPQPRCVARARCLDGGPRLRLAPRSGRTAPRRHCHQARPLAAYRPDKDPRRRKSHELPLPRVGGRAPRTAEGPARRESRCHGLDAFRERVAHQAEALRVAVGDDDVLGVGDDATDAAEVVRQSEAQRSDSARVAVAEVGVGDRRERLAQRAQPCRSRERRDVRHAGTEIEPRTRRRRRHHRLPLTGNRRRFRDSRAGALPQAQIPLGSQLGIGVHHDSPRNADLARQSTGGRHPRTTPQGAISDRPPKLVLDLCPECPGTIAAHRKEQLYRLTGLVQGHDCGSSICTSKTLASGRALDRVIRRRPTPVRHLDPRAVAAGDAQAGANEPGCRAWTSSPMLRSSSEVERVHASGS